MNPEFNLEEYIMHHLQDSSEISVPFLKNVFFPSFLTLHGIMILLCAVVLVILFCFFYDKKKRVPAGMTNLLELLILFIRDDISIKHLGEKDGRKMAPLFCTFFFFILGLNLMGMVPSLATATANVNVTAGLSLITLGFMIGGAIYKNGFKGFWNALKPSGIPVPVLFILIPIEFMGLFIKSFALTIRLFANMLAGHIVIICLLGVVVILGKVALPAVILALFISLLEILVAFLQAYIFTLLSAMFVGQMYHPNH